jgi:hypothetical protein
MNEKTRPESVSEDASESFARWLAEDPAVAAYFADIDLNRSAPTRSLRVDTERALERVKAALGMSSPRRPRGAQ